ncbi:MAG: response regulator transcription factor [Clostridia bacterium]|jgi:DNA-binding response OmpR family regulator|nr:response regulator transcription factor [Clostridia bacterium]MCI9086279.1 response regulator transcription factor [Clostridia bacterium]
MKILIVEDDKALNNGIALSFNNDETVQTYSIIEAENRFNNEIDLIILDINLPDGNGIDFCRKIRQTSRVPIIFLTANDMETDIVTGLESGADDYITKPFSLAVLRARVNAVLRRNESDESVFKESGFDFNFDTMTFFNNGMPVELSKTEQKLLKLFVNNRGRTLSRDMLIDRIWTDGAEFVEGNALSVAVRRLREKLTDSPIKTVYGIGYIWEK